MSENCRIFQERILLHQMNLLKLSKYAQPMSLKDFSVLLPKKYPIESAPARATVGCAALPSMKLSSFNFFSIDYTRHHFVWSFKKKDPIESAPTKI